MGRYTDSLGRAKRNGRNRTLEHINVRGKKKGNSPPLPTHLMCHPQRARPTYTPKYRVKRSFPQYEAMSEAFLRHRLIKRCPERSGWLLQHQTMGRLGWTDDYGLMKTLCLLGAGTTTSLRTGK